MRYLPSHHALMSFCVAARHESLTKAAAELNQTHGAISRAVKTLEEQLGVALFERRNRRVFLTDQGRMLADQAEPILNDLETLCRTIAHAENPSVLTLSCEPTLAMRWLMPRLEDLKQACEIEALHLATGGGPVDLVDQGIDLAIRRSDFKWAKDYWATPLFSEHTGPVCRPDYWKRYHQGQIGLTHLHTKTRLYAWKEWQAASGQVIKASNHQDFDHFYFSLQAAVAGLGIAIAPAPMVQDDLKNGHLIAPFGFTDTAVNYVALTRDNDHKKPVYQAIINWLRTHLNQDINP